MYRSQTSEDTLRGLKQIARRGFSAGGRPPTGYRNVRIPTGRIRPGGDPEIRTAWETDPAKAIDEAFKKQVTYFLNILEAADPPERTPGPSECRYCDITIADCPERREPEETDSTLGQEPEIPV